MDVVGNSFKTWSSEPKKTDSGQAPGKFEELPLGSATSEKFASVVAASPTAKTKNQGLNSIKAQDHDSPIASLFTYLASKVVAALNYFFSFELLCPEYLSNYLAQISFADVEPSQKGSELAKTNDKENNTSLTNSATSSASQPGATSIEPEQIPLPNSDKQKYFELFIPTIHATEGAKENFQEKYRKENNDIYQPTNQNIWDELGSDKDTFKPNGTNPIATIVQARRSDIPASLFQEGQDQFKIDAEYPRATTIFNHTLRVGIFKRKSDNTIILAFPGLENLTDYRAVHQAASSDEGPNRAKYDAADRLVKAFVEHHTKEKVMVVAYSGGGGPGLYAAKKNNVDGVGFNALGEHPVFSKDVDTSTSQITYINTKHDWVSQTWQPQTRMRQMGSRYLIDAGYFPRCDHSAAGLIKAFRHNNPNFSSKKMIHPMAKTRGGKPSHRFTVPYDKSKQGPKAQSTSSKKPQRMR